MLILKLDNGAASCHVMMPGFYDGKLMDGEDGRQAAMDHAIACEYFDASDRANIAAIPIRGDAKVGITWDCGKIVHTAEEWCAIYDCIIREPTIICQSEY